MAKKLTKNEWHAFLYTNFSESILIPKGVANHGTANNFDLDDWMCLFEQLVADRLGISQKGEGVKMLNCPVCDNPTLPEDDWSYHICPVCFWECDYFPATDEDLDEPSGPNHGITIREARQNFKKFGACEREVLPYVRVFSEDEPKAPEVEPLPFDLPEIDRTLYMCIECEEDISVCRCRGNK